VLDEVSAAIPGDASRRERKAEWLGNDNRKTMIKVKTIGQMLPFKNGTALPSPSQAPDYKVFIFLTIIWLSSILRG
jgi:hypothetical protein